MSNRPDFFVIGTQKGGTTALHQYLDQLPEFYLPEIKETKFFVDPARYEKGFDYYKSEHFSSAASDQVIGEIDPDLMYFPEALERMKKHINVETKKFIIVLREPTSRAFSHYLMTYRRGHETLPFDKALRVEKERLAVDSYFNRMHYSYADRGFYAAQIRRYLDIVPRENFLFISSSALKNNPTTELERVCNFLNVSFKMDSDLDLGKVHQAQIPKNAKFMQRLVNHGGWERKVLKIVCPSRALRERLWVFLTKNNLKSGSDEKLSDEVRAILADAFAGTRQELENMTGLDLSDWL